MARYAQHGGGGRVDAALVDEDNGVGKRVEVGVGVRQGDGTTGGGGAKGREPKPGEGVALDAPADGGVAEAAVTVEEHDWGGMVHRCIVGRLRAAVGRGDCGVRHQAES